MQLRRRSNGKVLNLGSELGAGGEARVYELVNDSTLVAKIYHQSTNVRIHKLAAMLANPPSDPMAAKGHVSIAWPVDLLEDTGNSHVVGFLMPRITSMHSIIVFYNPAHRRQQCPLFNYAYLHRAARNLAAAVHALHVRGYVIGDVNQNNILVTGTALVTVIDTDSFRVRDPHNGAIYRCLVGTPEFTPPELQGKVFAQVDRTPEHDLFGLAAIIFQLLMEGVHPFAGGLTKGGSDPSPLPEDRIATGYFPYATRSSVPYQPMPTAPPFDALHPKVQQLFVRCFEDGHNTSSARPDANAWQNALEDAEQALIPCPINNQHRYGKHLKACPWCERATRLGGLDPFPSQQAVRTGQHLQYVGPIQTPLFPAGIHPTAQSVQATARTQGHATAATPTILLPLASRIKPSRWLLSIVVVLGIGYFLTKPTESDKSRSNYAQPTIDLEGSEGTYSGHTQQSKSESLRRDREEAEAEQREAAAAERGARQEAEAKRKAQLQAEAQQRTAGAEVQRRAERGADAKRRYEQVQAETQRRYEQAQVEAQRRYEQVQVEAQRRYQQAQVEAQRRYQQAQANASNFRNLASAKNSYGRALASAKNSYERTLASARNSYERTRSSIQNSYERGLISARNSYERAQR